MQSAGQWACMNLLFFRLQMLHDINASCHIAKSILMKPPKFLQTQFCLQRLQINLVSLIFYEMDHWCQELSADNDYFCNYFLCDQG
jgi:hypothetical protein